MEAVDRQLEAVDRELNAFIEKRAKGREAANAAEASWKAPARERRQQTRRENALAWAQHYQSMARAHHDMAAQMAAKADDVLEQLGEQPKEASCKENERKDKS